MTAAQGSNASPQSPPETTGGKRLGTSAESEKMCWARHCPWPPENSLTLSPQKARETRNSDRATDGILTCFNCFFLGEPHEVCILFPEESHRNSCGAVSFQNSLVQCKPYNGGQTAYPADHSRTEPPQLQFIGPCAS